MPDSAPPFSVDYALPSPSWVKPFRLVSRSTFYWCHNLDILSPVLSFRRLPLHLVLDLVPCYHQVGSHTKAEDKADGSVCRSYIATIYYFFLQPSIRTEPSTGEQKLSPFSRLAHAPCSRHFKAMLYPTVVVIPNPLLPHALHRFRRPFFPMSPRMNHRNLLLSRTRSHGITIHRLIPTLLTTHTNVLQADSPNHYGQPTHLTKTT